MIFLSIDPSINHVGWTTFDTKEHLRGRKATDGWQWGTLELDGFNKVVRMVDLCQQLSLHLVQKIDHLVVEYPAFYSSEKGKIAAHRNFTIDLAHIAGFVAGTLGMTHRTYHPITAIEWKGAVQKEVTARKFFRLFNYPLRKISEHAVDSTMLLRYFLITYGRKLILSRGEQLPVTPLLPAGIWQ